MLEASNVANTLNWAANEASLLSGLRSGSEAAFDWLVERYQFEVYNLALRFLGEPQAAADITATVFAKSLCGFGKLPRGRSPRILLYRIAIRELLSSRGGRCPVALADGTAIGGSVPQRASQEPTAVREALHGLPKSLRAVLLLRDFAGLSYEETGEILHLTLDTVKLRVLQGRRELRERLDPLLACG